MWWQSTNVTDGHTDVTYRKWYRIFVMLKNTVGQLSRLIKLRCTPPYFHWFISRRNLMITAKARSHHPYHVICSLFSSDAMRWDEPNVVNKWCKRCLTLCPVSPVFAYQVSLTFIICDNDLGDKVTDFNSAHGFQSISSRLYRILLLIIVSHKTTRSGA